MTQSGTPWRVKDMTPTELAERLALRPSLIVPVGVTEPHGPDLPFGCDTIIVERLADDLSAKLGIPRTPTLEYGVNAGARDELGGGASLHRRTLQRVMNELIDSWEAGAGVREFVILTANGHEAHQEALSTLSPRFASARLVDVFALDLSPVLGDQPAGADPRIIETSLMLYLVPSLVRGGAREGATPQVGEALYRFILERVTTRIFSPHL